MNIENIVIAIKMSVLEYDAYRAETDLETALEKFTAMGVDGQKIIDSHYRQRESWEKVLDTLGNKFELAELVMGDNIRGILPNSLVIAIGGDNYLQLVSHFIGNQSLIGINSDPENSDGTLTHFTAESFIDFVPKLESGKFNIEEWTRLQATINGERIPTLATSEIYYGAYKSTDMSRYNLSIWPEDAKFLEEEQKSSGLIFATDAGITGWYKGAARYLDPSENYSDYPKQLKKVIAVVREPFGKYNLNSFALFNSCRIDLTWLAHGKGLISIDARDEYEITRGDTVEIRLSDTPLRVVTP